MHVKTPYFLELKKPFNISNTVSANNPIQCTLGKDF